MGKVVELKGKNIIDAYNGKKLSRDFGYSCANFNCDYQRNVDMDLFDIYVDNVNNISCFVYVNDSGKIEGRRMFFTGKQLLDDKIFPINTKLGENVNYLYGYYGNTEGNFYHMITRYVVNKYKNDIVCMDRGHYNKGVYDGSKEHWVMQIENMDYPEFPAIDFIYASSEIKSFANFNPSLNLRNWLVETYGEEGVTFNSAYHFKPGADNDDFLKHWNQKFFTDNEDDDNEEEVQEEVQENVKKFGSKTICPHCGKNSYGDCC